MESQLVTSDGCGVVESNDETFFLFEQRRKFHSHVLTPIFDLLTNPSDIKTVRQLCKSFNEAGTPILSKMTTFNLCGRENENYTNFEYNVDNIDTRLLRRIKVRPFITTQGDQEENEDSTHEEIVDFMSKYSSFIEELYFEVNISFHPTLLRLVENVLVDFSKLKKISLHEVSSRMTSLFVWDAVKFKDVKLNSVETLELFGHEAQLDEIRFYEYYPIFQELINISPNLVKIKIAENFYPDFKSSTKLKELEWTGFMYREIRSSVCHRCGFSTCGRLNDRVNGFRYKKTRDDFSPSELVNIITQVKDTLESLELGLHPQEITDLEDHVSESYGFTPILPILPNLTNLTIAEVGLGLSTFVINLTSTSTPNLKIMTCGDAYLIFDYWDDEENKVFPKLESFKLKNTSGYVFDSLFSTISTAFPNLRQLELDLCPWELNQKFMSILSNHFGESLKYLKLNLMSAFYEKETMLVNVMDGISYNGFKDFKKLEIVLAKSSLIKLNAACDNFEPAFLTWPNLVLNGFLLYPETRSKMKDFILKHNLDGIRFFNK